MFVAVLRIMMSNSGSERASNSRRDIEVNFSIGLVQVRFQDGSSIMTRMGEGVALASCIFATAFYALGQGTRALELFANYGLIAYMGLAAVIGIWVYRNLAGSLMARIALGYALGFVSWLVGLAIYTYAYYIIETGLSYLSVTDVFYLLSYPPWMISAISMLRMFGKELGGRIWATVLAIGLALLVLVAVYVIPPSISDLQDPLEVFVTVVYPSLDVLFFMMVLALFFVFRTGVFEKAFAFMALGTVLLTLGDLTYTVLNVGYVYYDGHPMDLLLFFGCVSAAYGFWCQHADLSTLK